MKPMRMYYSMEKNNDEANINIYGDISSWDDNPNNMKALSKVLDELTDVKKIKVYINSYGGEVAEGLAIYNALKRHPAKVTTYCDGFAASIASVIFMAGDKRIMNESSLLMIHNAWSWGEGNAEQLRKQADALDKITQASVVAYMSHSNLSEEKIKALMDAETWILPDEALEYGFATAIEKVEKTTARMSLVNFIKMHHKQADEDENDEEENPSDDEPSSEDSSDDDEDNPSEGEEDSEENESEEDENKAAQQLSGLFNAILKM